MVKRQHLVWRNYLSQWTDDINSTNGNLCCYFKQTKKVLENVNINNLAVERYTYDISNINENDKSYVCNLLNAWLCKKTDLKLQGVIVNNNDIFKKDFIENNIISEIEINGIDILNILYSENFPFDGPTSLEKYISLQKKVTLYKMLSSEINSDNEISNNEYKQKDLDNQEDKRFKFYEYISNQFLRTWKTKENILYAKEETLKMFPSSDLAKTTSSIFPLLMVIYTFILANALCENNFYIELIKNTSNQNFITGDCPVINLIADYNLKEENLKKLELFYPITPKLAIICKNTIKNNTIKTIHNVNEIDKLNNKIYEAATKQVYACEKKDLNKYIT